MDTQRFRRLSRLIFVSFVFDHVFDETTENSTIYSTVVKDLVSRMFAGGKVLLFAYGQVYNPTLILCRLVLEKHIRFSATTRIIREFIFLLAAI